MGFFSESQRRGLVVMASLLVILLLIYLLADRMQPTILLEEPTASAVALQPFDPNVDSYEAMREKGVPVEVAVGIVRWRSYGKVYRLREDLALVSGMTDSLYILLAPYAIITDSVAACPRPSYSAEREDKYNQNQTIHPKVEYPAERFAIDTVTAE